MSRQGPKDHKYEWHSISRFRSKHQIQRLIRLGVCATSVQFRLDSGI